MAPTAHRSLKGQVLGLTHIRSCLRPLLSSQHRYPPYRGSSSTGRGFHRPHDLAFLCCIGMWSVKAMWSSPLMAHCAPPANSSRKRAHVHAVALTLRNLKPALLPLSAAVSAPGRTPLLLPSTSSVSHHAQILGTLSLGALRGPQLIPASNFPLPGGVNILC